ncbi:MAG: diguanylate cyclase [Acidobacteria bacterium]|nr:diguanylate cyclase [Acidobacteriota bacterium]
MKVLIAEDNPVFQRMLAGMLRNWGYEVVSAQNGDEAWALLQSPESPRLAVLDWMMPGPDGLEICRRIRARGDERYIYVLLLTARTETKDLVAGMEAGADDYLTKPFNAHELRVRLRAGRRILELQEELLAAKEELRHQAMRDSLTGLWNRASIFDILHQELARASRNATPLAVLMADLDGFKGINDTYGHLTGDAVLRESVRRMSAEIRCYDAIGRYGGEEFLIVLPGCDESGAKAQAERLREMIASKPFQAQDTLISVTCSIGVSWTTMPDVSQTDLLVRYADSAMYSAKREGRNRVHTSAREALSEAIPA